MCISFFTLSGRSRRLAGAAVASVLIACHLILLLGLQQSSQELETSLPGSGGLLLSKVRKAGLFSCLLELLGPASGTADSQLSYSVSGDILAELLQRYCTIPIEVAVFLCLLTGMLKGVYLLGCSSILSKQTCIHMLPSFPFPCLGPAEKVFHCSHCAGFSSRSVSNVSAPTSSGQHDCWPLSHRGLKSVSGLVAAASAGK